MSRHSAGDLAFGGTVLFFWVLGVLGSLGFTVLIAWALIRFVLKYT